jgi:hypothetical protein
MNPETKENIRNLAQTYMSNPNAIILCIQVKHSEVKCKENILTLIGDPSPDHADCGWGMKPVLVMAKQRKVSYLLLSGDTCLPCSFPHCSWPDEY